MKMGQPIAYVTFNRVDLTGMTQGPAVQLGRGSVTHALTEDSCIEADRTFEIWAEAAAPVRADNPD